MTTTPFTTQTFYIFVDEDGAPKCIGGGVKRTETAALHLMVNGREYVALPMTGKTNRGTVNRP